MHAITQLLYQKRTSHSGPDFFRVDNQGLSNLDSYLEHFDDTRQRFPVHKNLLMFKNYLKTAIRGLRKNSMYSAINITGLALSLAVSILLLLWVKDEISYDRFHTNASRIYKLAPSFDGEHMWNSTPAPIAVYAKQSVPEVEDACRISENRPATVFEYKGKIFSENLSCLADASFFSMFSFPLIEGNNREPFNDAYSVVLSKKTAETFFGNENAMGKVLRGDDQKLYRVSGVMEDMPANSSLQYNMVFNMLKLEQDYNAIGNFRSLNTNWDQYSYLSYVMLKPSADAALASKKLGETHRRNYDIQANKNLSYRLHPLADSHLYGIDGSAQGIMVVRVFFIVALIVLLIGCINYVNLVTAQAIKRMKEISVRKIIGAGKTQLFMQFLTDALVSFTIALAPATVIIYMVMPVYNNISGKEIVFQPWSLNVLSVYAIVLLATLVLAGIYPAISLSSFKPLEAIKGKLSAASNKSGFRKVLVVIQFCFSIVLIASTIIIGKQLKFIQQKNLGYNRENIFSVPMHNISDHYDATVAELMKERSVIGVSYSAADIINSSSGSSAIDWDGKTADQQSFTVIEMPVERNFLKLMNIELAEGNGFSGTPADSSNFILNETAIKMAGIRSPVIGKRLNFQGINGSIAGVVKDFHFQDLHQEIRPLVIKYKSQPGGRIYVKTTTKDAQAALAATEKAWKKYNADYSFDYSFLDAQFDRLYKSDIQVGQLFNYFAIVTILISCLGLFGLVNFIAESKVKEIGVRKVLGAGVAQIILLLSKDFIVLVAIAALVATPIAWYGLHNFLQGYAYRTDLSWWVFALAGVVTLFISMITVSVKCVQAALANPVKALKSE